NPYGFRLYEIFGNVLQDEYLLSRIGEMMPADLRYVWVLEGTVVLMLGVALRPRRVRGWLLWLAGAFVLHRIFGAIDPYPWAQTALALPIYVAGIVRTRPPGALAH